MLRGARSRGIDLPDNTSASPGHTQAYKHVASRSQRSYHHADDEEGQSRKLCLLARVRLKAFLLLLRTDETVEESPRGSVSAGRTSGCSIEAFVRAFVRGIIYKNYAGYQNEQHTDQPFFGSTVVSVLRSYLLSVIVTLAAVDGYLARGDSVGSQPACNRNNRKSHGGRRKAKRAQNVHVSVAMVKTFNIQLDVKRNTCTNFLKPRCLGNTSSEARRNN
ncbi:hypothetical protein M514_02384 [Trichuris suis]|uniref:Uncharacterized protein n=1 Tax=Trichuris suis TaxID=68888 RepID=A0A085MSD9_9BILA|nr:hypothetical protein M514_02384 [Trichuris suis]